MTQGTPFYAVGALADYTLARDKVVWREQASEFTAAVVASPTGKPVIPDHKLMLCAVDSPQEAFYLCAALNSSPSVLAVHCFSIGTQMSTHILESIAVPCFEPDNPVHQRLADLSQRAHELAAELSTDPEPDKRTELEQALADVEAQVDEAAAALWGITPQELAEVQRNLAELRG